MSTYERAAAGEYEPKIVIPERPREPAILRKAVKDLTPEEYASVPAVVAAFEAAKVEHAAARQAYSVEGGRLHTQFQADLEEEHGMTGHPKAAKLYAKASEDGHSGGLAEVASVYGNLVDLVK
jgi:hypothetical protein